MKFLVQVRFASTVDWFGFGLPCLFFIDSLVFIAI